MTVSECESRELTQSKKVEAKQKPGEFYHKNFDPKKFKEFLKNNRLWFKPSHPEAIVSYANLIDAFVSQASELHITLLQ
jgi:hypothetical protein